MHRRIAALAGLIMTAALTACGGGSNDEAPTSRTTPEVQTTAAAPASAVIEPNADMDTSVENGRPADREGLTKYLTEDERDLLLVNPFHLAKSICGLFDAGYTTSDVEDAVHVYLNTYYRAQSGSGVIWPVGGINFYTYNLTLHTCPEYVSKF